MQGWLSTRHALGRWLQPLKQGLGFGLRWRSFAASFIQQAGVLRTQVCQQALSRLVPAGRFLPGKASISTPRLAPCLPGAGLPVTAGPVRHTPKRLPASSVPSCSRACQLDWAQLVWAQAEAERFVLRPFLLPNEHSEEPRASASADPSAHGQPRKPLQRTRTKSILECAPAALPLPALPPGPSQAAQLRRLASLLCLCIAQGHVCGHSRQRRWLAGALAGLRQLPNTRPTVLASRCMSDSPQSAQGQHGEQEPARPAGDHR